MPNPELKKELTLTEELQDLHEVLGFLRSPEAAMEINPMAALNWLTDNKFPKEQLAAIMFDQDTIPMIKKSLPLILEHYQEIVQTVIDKQAE